jgi:hypothetical protein
MPLAGVAAEAGQYADMRSEGYWSYNALNAAVDNGLLQGDENGKLNPAAKLTRAEAAKVLAYACGATGQASVSFSDVASGSWYYKWVAIAVKMGIFKGNGDGTFSPNGYITREQTFTAIARALDIKSDDMSSLGVFSDKDSISDYAKTSLAGMAARGYLKGSGGKLNPKGYITREEFAQVMYNIFNIYYIDMPGVYVGNYKGSVIISSPGVTLKDSTVKGDIVVADGVGDGDVVINTVTMGGKLVIRGGGANSVKVIKVTVVTTLPDGTTKSADLEVAVLNTAEGGTRLVFEDMPGGTKIKIDTEALASLGATAEKPLTVVAPKTVEITDMKGNSVADNSLVKITAPAAETGTSGGSGGSSGGGGGTTVKAYRVGFTLEDTQTGEKVASNLDFSKTTAVSTALLNLMTDSAKKAEIEEVFAGKGLSDEFESLLEYMVEGHNDAELKAYIDSLNTGHTVQYYIDGSSVGTSAAAITDISVDTTISASLGSKSIRTYVAECASLNVKLTVTVQFS